MRCTWANNFRNNFISASYRKGGLIRKEGFHASRIMMLSIAAVLGLALAVSTAARVPFRRRHARRLHGLPALRGEARRALSRGASRRAGQRPGRRLGGGHPVRPLGRCGDRHGRPARAAAGGEAAHGHDRREGRHRGRRQSRQSGRDITAEEARKIFSGAISRTGRTWAARTLRSA